MIRRSRLSTANALVVNQNHQTLPTSTDFFSFMFKAHYVLSGFSIVYSLQRTELSYDVAARSAQQIELLAKLSDLMCEKLYQNRCDRFR